MKNKVWVSLSQVKHVIIESIVSIFKVKQAKCLLTENKFKLKNILLDLLAQSSDLISFFLWIFLF